MRPKFGLLRYGPAPCRLREYVHGTRPARDPETGEEKGWRRGKHFGEGRSPQKSKLSKTHKGPPCELVGRSDCHPSATALGWVPGAANDCDGRSTAAVYCVVLKPQRLCSPQTGWTQTQQYLVLGRCGRCVDSSFWLPRLVLTTLLACFCQGSITGTYIAIL